MSELKKIDYFKPDDFKSVFTTERDNDYEDVADFCNEKLNALFETWPVVQAAYGAYPENVCWYRSQPPSSATHQALLAFIEPLKLEPCKHEPYIKYILGAEGCYPKFAACEKCGVELVADWKTTNETP